VTPPDERAYWLALLSDPQVDRSRAKAAIYGWAIEQQQRLDALAGLPSDALRERLPDLDAAQAAAWRQALGQAEAAGQVLAQWQGQGIELITRADAAYPENWVERLAERWLPYTLFYRGNLELLANPAVCLAGAEEPGEAAGDAAEAAAARLGPGAHVLLGGYGQGIDRRALTAGSQALGRTILILPVGFAHAGPILRAGQMAVEQGRRIELSPFEPEAAYAPALGRARSLLVTALAEALALFEPALGPDAWPGYEPFAQHGGLALIWEGGGADMRAAWQAAGARPFADADAIERQIAGHLLPAVDEIVLDQESEDALEAGPVQFDDADSAIRRLSETGRVPDKLARRLREAEERGLLGEEGA
jgi:predicted Rossmann fold nucleotide-binding protein DprA/Smf involved in DNA uptake